ncbi:FecR family protein [Sphingobacterium paucimobilis]|uniref:FecR family protein n=1 Tax=Sphingobacterium paucimobilis HER1398 TaxID=1346330 RepID=U2HFB7_9SPHI|nr:FecR domain-containing protein [Sphingobacterium paucimobilis]ERJ60461.1 hypothetical protein M472_17045 [Sphingobacterium paucimobilis HER1398]
MVDKEKIAYLHQQYLQDSLTAAELQDWIHTLSIPENQPYLQELVYGTWDGMNNEDGTNLRDNRSEEIFNEITKQSPIVTRPIILWRRIVAAASIIISITIGGYYYQSKNTNKQPLSYDTYANDAAPGKTSATLTLANGKKIKLTGAANGTLAQEAGVIITKTTDGQVIYEITGSNTDSDNINELATVNGETYRLRLPDGSEVWLNASSSLKYPANFTALNERRVQLKGEAYFEIAKNKQKPFVVQSTGQEVRVLGTHFNVNAYSDENEIKTTLLEGIVRVSSLKSQILLKPGEQSIFQNEKIEVTSTDIESATAWKNGLFMFNNENLASVMRKISRWYDLDVKYEDKSLENLPFEGSITRFSNVSKVLRMLELTKLVKFKLEGKTVTVYSTKKQ